LGRREDLEKLRREEEEEVWTLNLLGDGSVSYTVDTTGFLRCARIRSRGGRQGMRTRCMRQKAPPPVSHPHLPRISDIHGRWIDSRVLAATPQSSKASATNTGTNYISVSLPPAFAIAIASWSEWICDQNTNSYLVSEIMEAWAYSITLRPNYDKLISVVGACYQASSGGLHGGRLTNLARAHKLLLLLLLLCVWCNDTTVPCAIKNVYCSSATHCRSSCAIYMMSVCSGWRNCIMEQFIEM
jgi:hypothetical protein